MVSESFAPSRRAQFFKWAGVVVGVVVLLALFKGYQIWSIIQMSSSFGPPPDSVTTVKAQFSEWPQTLRAVGTLTSRRGSDLSSESNGEVKEIHVESGQAVKAGEVLVTLESSVESGELQAAQVRYEEAERVFVRAEQLVKQNVISKSDYDTARTLYKEAEARVRSFKGLVDRRKIVAPFDGRIGIRHVNVGQYVTSGARIVSLVELDPLFVDFSLPQRDLAKLSKGLLIKVKVDGEAAHIVEGRITAIDAQVDSSTRNISVQGEISNSDLLLRPGMFADIEVVLPDVDRFIVIPTSGIQFAPYGNSVFVIDTDAEKGAEQGDDKDLRPVKQQIVQLGRYQGDYVSVVSGLNEGQEIVTSGTFRLRPGLFVKTRNQQAPNAEIEPDLENS